MTPRTLADRYELSSKIGSGGMGTVWRGRDKLLDRAVAVKILHEGLASDAIFAERFRREALAAASLAHPNLVAVYDTGEEDGIPFIVMEYHDGESLHARLAREGALPAEDTARIARSTLAALGHAHSRGLVHRDMKPANVLLDAKSDEAKVVDFGIAKSIEDTGGGLTRTSGLIGTAAYLSPEQVSGQNATPASDLYAVGCLMYACLVGDPPFGGGSPVAVAMSHVRDPVPPLSARRPDISLDLEAIVLHALEKDPLRRFSSAEEMDAAIAATGLDRRPSTEPTLYAAPIAVAAAPTVAAGSYGAEPARSGTEVIERPAKQQGPGALAALTAFLIAAAIAALAVLYLQNREQVPLEGQLPTPTVAPATLSPTLAPTEAPQDNNGNGNDGSVFGNLPVIGDD
ncbi:MAG: protein kinase [Actinomycetota bacterium]